MRPEAQNKDLEMYAHRFCRAINPNSLVKKLYLHKNTETKPGNFDRACGFLA
jgi:hypothetical protein